MRRKRQMTGVTDRQIAAANLARQRRAYHADISNTVYLETYLP
jgi:hypothetical protein